MMSTLKDGLQVILARDGESWIAQAVELDYAACGNSEQDARSRFEDGLYLTIQEHLDRFGSLESFLELAPPEHWLDLSNCADSKGSGSSLISVHKISQSRASFPFRQIRYVTSAEAQD